jgi:hypothetical protein
MLIKVMQVADIQEMLPQGMQARTPTQTLFNAFAAKASIGGIHHTKACEIVMDRLQVNGNLTRMTDANLQAFVLSNYDSCLNAAQNPPKVERRKRNTWASSTLCDDAPRHVPQDPPSHAARVRFVNVRTQAGFGKPQRWHG